jgi:uncharacterized protein (TIGR03435 family)
MRSFLRLPATLILFVAPVTCSGALHGQDSSGQRPQAAPVVPMFDVAAIHIHESQPHEHNSIWSSPSDGRFRTENISVISLIHWAYEMPDSRILGAPTWTGTAHFNIDATADPSVDQQLKGLTPDAGRKQKEKMVQGLLADRFKLAVHTETRELAIYALVVAKGGAKLGSTQESGTTINTGSGRMEVEGSNSVPLLAEELSKVVGRDVIDKTGLSGRYDLKLKWTPDDAAQPQLLNGAPVEGGPSIFTALEEQLGLKLEPTKGPVQVLVIDHVEMPSAN